MTRRLGWLGLVAALVAAGAYTAVYLYRWEWSRALWTTMVFVAIEVAIATALVLRKLAHLAARLDRLPDQEQVEALLAAHRPAHDRFAWLEEQQQRLGVFVTMVIGGGFLVSGLAWLLDRIAARTTTPAGERRLAAELAAIEVPTGPIVPPEALLLAEDLPYGDAEDLQRLVGGGPA